MREQGKQAGAIPFPEGGFEPENRTRTQSKIRDFYDTAWEDYQRKHPDACITDETLVLGLRRAWYKYLKNLDPVEYSLNKLRATGTNWYRAARNKVEWQRPAKTN